MADPGFWRGRRVLLTGHTGFKGAWLALWLTQLGAEVHGLADGVPTTPSLFQSAHVAEELAADVRADVRDAVAVAAAVRAARPEVVVHLAAQPLVRTARRAPAETYAVNVMGTVALLDAVRALDGPPPAVVVVTSDKCYRESRAPHREDDPLGGRDPYASSKAAQELVAAAYRDTFGLRLATARAGNVIGGGDWAADRLVADVMRGALSGTPVVLRAPAAVRPWQHVLNPLSGYLLLAQRLAAGDAVAGAWNFGPDEGDARPVAWVAERLRERWPGPLELRLGDDAAGEAAVLRLDSTRARRELGWRPAWALSAGLDATVAWFDAYRRGVDPRTVTVGQIMQFTGGRSA